MGYSIQILQINTIGHCLKMAEGKVLSSTLIIVHYESLRTFRSQMRASERQRRSAYQRFVMSCPLLVKYYVDVDIVIVIF
jgi:hypothetical protein